MSRIAALANAKVIPAIPVREADNTVTLQFYPAWKSFPSEDAQADAQRMNRFIEERVREHPEQYSGCTSVSKPVRKAAPILLTT
ncbi:lipid A biosynthesis lauroyl acyltransferase [Neisseria gonorrhoeae]|uniref:Lipid A biosynthesis lauroyl acyltransferase n=1 Tax=Neisseria gonorrhoeae TaxID=485 RepID=A0A378W2G9_NEIGO|nr:lipid A biosynthesis lauroyl acyltransferase [Neisseria gonorrhoeae]